MQSAIVAPHYEVAARLMTSSVPRISQVPKLQLSHCQRLAPRPNLRRTEEAIWKIRPCGPRSEMHGGRNVGRDRGKDRHGDLR